MGVMNKNIIIRNLNILHTKSVVNIMFKGNDFNEYREFIVIGVREKIISVDHHCKCSSSLSQITKARVLQLLCCPSLTLGHITGQQKKKCQKSLLSSVTWADYTVFWISEARGTTSLQLTSFAGKGQTTTQDASKVTECVRKWFLTYTFQILIGGSFCKTSIHHISS